MNGVHALRADLLHDRTLHHLADRSFFRRACAARNPAQGQVGREAALLGREPERSNVLLDGGLQAGKALPLHIAHGHPDHARPAQVRETASALNGDIERREPRARCGQCIRHPAHAAHGRVAQELKRQVHGIGRHPLDAAVGRLALEFRLDAADPVAHRLVQLDRDESPQCEFWHRDPQFEASA